MILISARTTMAGETITKHSISSTAAATSPTLAPTWTSSSPLPVSLSLPPMPPSQSNHTRATSVSTTSSLHMEQDYDGNDESSNRGDQDQYVELDLASIENDLFDRRDLLEKIRQQYNQQSIPKCCQSNPTERKFMLVSGPSGVGKSTLVMKSLEPLVRKEKEGFFVMGRCERQATEPYAPFVDAMSRLVAQILDDADQDGMDRIRSILRDMPERQVLLDIFPALLHILGQQQEQPQKQSKEDDKQKEETLVNKGREEGHVDNRCGADSKQTGTITLAKFLRNFCSVKHPSVLVLQDLHWIDPVSAEMFHVIATDRAIQGLYIVGTTTHAQHDTCDGPNYSFPMLIRGLESNSVLISRIAIGNLSQESVHQMIGTMLRVSSDKAKSLGNIIYQHSKGNPFMTLQFLRMIHKKRLIQYENNSDTWTWDEESIVTDMRLSHYDDVLCCAVGSDGFLTPSIQQFLMVASSLGNTFSLYEISCAIGDKTSRSIKKSLAFLLSRGLMQRHPGKRLFGWTHNRFKQASYSLMSPTEQEELHLLIGRNFLRKMSPERIDRHLFVIANQFLSCCDMIIDEMESVQVAMLFFDAGCKAAKCSDFDTACSYLLSSIDLVQSLKWDDYYDLLLALHNAAAEMACCKGNIDAVDHLTDVILENANCLQDKLRAYETKIYSLGTRHDLEGSIKVGLAVLSQLGEPIPTGARYFLLPSSKIHKAKAMIRERENSQIIDGKPLRDWKKLAALRIMHLLVFPCLRKNVSFGPSIIARSIEITIKHGVCATSCVSFMWMAMLFYYPMGYPVEAQRCVDISLAIMEKFNAADLKCRVLNLVAGYCSAWREPYHDCLERLSLASQSGFATGDIEVACFSLLLSNDAAFAAGMPLDTVLARMEQVRNEILPFRQRTVLKYQACLMQMVLNFLGRSKDLLTLTGDVFDEDQFLSEMANDAIAIEKFMFFKTILAVFTHQYDLAKQFRYKWRKREKQAVNTFSLHSMTFISAMVEVGEARQSLKKSSLSLSPGQYNSRMDKLSSLKILRKLAQHSPINLNNKLCLVEAERHMLLNQPHAALAKYDQAIHYANKQGFLHEEALGYERGGMALLEWNKQPQALKYLSAARSIYEMWGSPIKVEQVSNFIAQHF